jgi:S-adenosylmethionine:tRNA ribosyltransferase-isomerase
MRAAAWPRPRPLEERLLHVDARTGTFVDRRLADLPDLLRAGDLLVVNDAATLPASIRGTTEGGETLEIRLAGQGEREWSAVVFGAGDWTTRTEDRRTPPRLRAGDVLRLDGDLGATVRWVDPHASRLVGLELDRDGPELWSALYRAGRPVQYSYVRAPLDLWHVQTPYASRPWAMEAPSAGRPLTWALLGELRARGIGMATLTHAAGLSSTGDAALDARLPLPERFEVPAPTVAEIEEARGGGGRVIAVGTSVVRALESAASGGRLEARTGYTRLRIGPGYRPRAADGVLTGLHEPDSGHFALLSAFAPAERLAAAHRHADEAGYLGHEFGDSCLLC